MSLLEPLTSLLSQRKKNLWNEDCQKAFDTVKTILKSEPVVLGLNFVKELKLGIDANNIFSLERFRELMQSDLFQVRFLAVSSMIIFSNLKWLKFWHDLLVE